MTLIKHLRHLSENFAMFMLFFFTGGLCNFVSISFISRHILFFTGLVSAHVLLVKTVLCISNQSY